MGGSEVCTLTSAQPACWWGLCPDQPAWLHTHPGPFISPSCPAHHGRSLTPLQRPEQSPNTQPGHVGPFHTHTRMHGTIRGSGLCVHLDWCATLGPACILGMSGWLPLGGLSEGGSPALRPPGRVPCWSRNPQGLGPHVRLGSFTAASVSPPASWARTHTEALGICLKCSESDVTPIWGSLHLTGHPTPLRSQPNEDITCQTCHICTLGWGHSWTLGLGCPPGVA